MQAQILAYHYWNYSRKAIKLVIPMQGIEIHYQEGWKILPVPMRTEVVLYTIDGKNA